MPSNRNVGKYPTLLTLRIPQLPAFRPPHATITLYSIEA